MLGNFSTRINNEASHRTIDSNGFLFVDKSPVMRAGILEYLGKELSNTGDVDGVRVDPEKVYKVFVSRDELEKAADSFTLLPLVNGHEWLGRDASDAKEFQEGTTGETAEMEGDLLMVPLKWTSLPTVAQITNGEKEELSSSYEYKLRKSDNDEYDFIGYDLKGNHVALVDKGRCGENVRVLNTEILTKGKNMKVKNVKAFEKLFKASNEVKLTIDGKEIDLDKFFTEEKAEINPSGAPAHEAINGDEAILELLKDKVDEDTLAKVKGLLEADDDTEVENGNDPELSPKTDTDKESGAKAMNEDAIVAKLAKTFETRSQNEAASLRKAYNEASAVLGDFNAFGMTDRDVYVKALNHIGITVDKETTVEMSAMLRAYNATHKVDNAAVIGNATATDEVDINI